MTDYKLLKEQILSLAQEEKWYLPLLSNASALLYAFLDGVNWAGFYLLKGEDLILGPFQGKVACIRIPLGKGVCGTAARSGKTVRVDDVHLFPGHIACDSASNAEIVVPLFRDGVLFGVMDIDSPTKNRFTAEDEAGLEAIARLIGDMAVIDDL